MLSLAPQDEILCNIDDPRAKSPAVDEDERLSTPPPTSAASVMPDFVTGPTAADPDLDVDAKVLLLALQPPHLHFSPFSH